MQFDLVAQEHDDVGLNEVRQMDADSNLNPRVVVQGLTFYPVGKVIEEGLGESTSISNAGTNFILYWFNFTCLNLQSSGRLQVRLDQPQEFMGLIHPRPLFDIEGLSPRGQM